MGMFGKLNSSNFYLDLIVANKVSMKPYIKYSGSIVF